METEKDSVGGTPEVPEKIKRHVPRPVLRPGGSWRPMADDVDRLEREKRDADKARNGWAVRLAESRKRGIGYRMGRGKD